MINNELQKQLVANAAAFDSRDLRQALSAFGTGVTVVTTLDADARPVGVTANSFNSVSLEPPIVLWSLRKASPSLPAFDTCGRFVIHVLTLDQMPLSQRFASPVPEKFRGVAHAPGGHGLPVLEGCAAVFECQTEQRHEVGDHILYLGRVQAYQHRPSAGLLFCQGRYAQGVSLAQSAA
ncbi:MAG: flavin reductase family protein [Hydrogenophaga sp.]|jgi:3-hydroxy-9,10-secoandrosta-1,3,5(10)-triene-9,17-dione monooxygenase reductase component|uniref:flavin reductase family protein n=1 Tax=Hydrogenophaga sp. TaxID=1904254 RepID=UPI001DE2B28B|nr:flavin reductase family protein [Hydrogenophaga sp.]MBW0168929.1 flavin reductase family protein [Hydrogenophaga sp.]MBW0184842.1 flavin reductase family protein [Hydrogenophaga sp.]